MEGEDRSLVGGSPELQAEDPVPADQMAVLEGTGGMGPPGHPEETRGDYRHDPDHDRRPDPWHPNRPGREILVMFLLDVTVEEFVERHPQGAGYQEEGLLLDPGPFALLDVVDGPVGEPGLFGQIALAEVLLFTDFAESGGEISAGQIDIFRTIFHVARLLIITDTGYR